MVGTRKTAPWSDHAIARLQNGPVAYERLVAEMMALVPPGRGYRAAVSASDAERARTTGSTKPRLIGDPEEDRMRRIRSGQRRLVVHSLNEMIKRGRFEEFEVDGVRTVRKGPDNYDEIKARRANNLSDAGKGFLRAVGGDRAIKVESLVPGLMTTIPRAEAIAKARNDRERAYERSQNRHRRSDRRPYRIAKTEEDDYLMGARRMVIDSLTNLVNYERITSVGTADERVIYKGPAWYDPDAPTA